MSEVTEAEMRLMARWRGEASKIYCQDLTEDQQHDLDAHEAFVLGYIAGRIQSHKDAQ